MLTTKFWRRFLPVLCLLLSSCQDGLPASGWLPGSSITATLTPFQAQSPTVPPTATTTPLPSATPVPTETPLPTPTPTTPPCQNKPGSVEVYEEIFAEGRRPFAFRVYRPPCFGQEDALYPVIYIIHGQSYNDDQWDRLGIDETADAMIHAGQAKPFLIVMPREFNTYEDIFLSTFASDVTDYLVPWIDANYPTCADRACRAIGGLSRGGAWALRLGFTRWDLFSAVGLHSTPPFIGDPNRFPSWLSEIPSDQVPRIWMDTGKADWYIRPTTQFEGILTDIGVPHEWYLFNGTHDEAYWSAHVVDYLEWYTGPWQ